MSNTDCSTTPLSFRLMLESEYQKRQQKNSVYSLRAFARDLGVSASHLIEVLSGRYGLSPKSATTIAQKIFKLKSKQDLFVALVTKEHGRTQKMRSHAENFISTFLKNKKYINIDLKNFSLMSNWYYLAFLELIDCKGFKFCHKWVAGRLNVHPEVIQQIISKLIQLGILRIEGKNLYPQDLNNFFGNEISNREIKKFHLETMEKAKMAIFEQDLKEREFTSLTIALNTKDIELAKKRIRQFIINFSEEFGEVDEKDQVYSLSLQFFRLTH